MTRVLALCLLVACFPATKPEQTAARETGRAGRSVAVEKRVVVNQSRTAGYMTTATSLDGTIAVTYHEVENGRGPHIDATIELAPDWTLRSFRAKGNHVMGTAVDETFTRVGDKATWKSQAEAGERTVQGTAFFLPIAPMPIEPLLVPAAIKAGGKLALLPGGDVDVRQVATFEVAAGGKKRSLVGYALSGHSIETTYTWFDRNGDWFGNVSEWSSVVPEGWEVAIEPLVAKQRDLSRARDAQLAMQHATRPLAGLAFTGARVLDVEKGVWIPDQTVIVQGDTIKTVGPTAKVKIPDGIDVIAIDGQALIPGLIDMHAHTYATGGVIDIASGVTTVRDVGNEPDMLDDFKKRFDEGTAIGPSIVRMGFIEGRGPKAASSKVTATTPDEAKAAVEFYAKRGYEGIKIYNSVPVAIVPLLAQEAHARRMQVIGHIPVHMLAHEAVKAGYDGIEHINMLFLNFLATHDTDTRDITRFTLVGERAGEVAMDGKPLADFIALLVGSKTIVDPTVGVFQDLLVGEPGKFLPGTEPLMARLPLLVQRWFLTSGLPVAPQKRATFNASFDQLLAMIKTLWANKVHLVLGTDSMLTGLWLHREMELFVKAGVPAKDVLRMATLDAARGMRLDKKIGSIAVGKRADLVVVDGDPLADISQIRKTVFTMRAGVLYKSDALYAAVGVKP